MVRGEKTSTVCESIDPATIGDGREGTDAPCALVLVFGQKTKGTQRTNKEVCARRM